MDRNKDLVRFVRSLELEENTLSGSRRNLAAFENTAVAYMGSDPSEGSPEDEDDTAFVDAGSLASFTSQLNGQQKQDVLNSTLLAQLAANKKYNRFDHPDDWYQFYTNVLSNIGWVLEGLSFDKYNSSANEFQISEVVLEFLSALTGGKEELVKVVKGTLDSLQKSKERLTLFSSNSTSGNCGNFQALPCTVDKSNQITVGFTGFHFTAKQVANDYLFVTYSSQDITLFMSGQVFTLNEEVYAKVRNHVVDKLGKNANDFIDRLNIEGNV